MQIIRKDIFKKFKWLKDKNRPFIISADYDGLMCSAFLSHYLKWNLVGYYNMENIWITDDGIKNKKDIIWVDLNILPEIGKSIGGHITILDNQIPKGLTSSCNLNVIRNITNTDFKGKYPLSTLSFLLWLYNTPLTMNNFSKFLILHSDSMWLKYQKYTKNVNKWFDVLEKYQWDNLFNNIDSIDFEKQIDQNYYPILISSGIFSGFSKLSSKHLNIKSREYKFNPDWDIDVMLNLYDLIKNNLKWNTPKIPIINKKIKGKKYTTDLNHVKKIGLSKFLVNNNVFSYAITSPQKIKYTVFDKIK